MQDALTPHRNEAQGQESRIVAQLLTLMDGVRKREQIVVVAATNRPNAIDPALRRPGRFDRDLAVEVPSEAMRLEILQSLTSALPLADSVDLETLAVITNGYVAADLVGLVRETALSAVYSEPPKTLITLQDFQEALKKSGGPSVKRGYTLSVDKLDWSSLGGLGLVREQLTQAIEWPLLYGDTFKKLGLVPPRGILLYGPPGCSKTTIAKVHYQTLLDNIKDSRVYI